MENKKISELDEIVNLKENSLFLVSSKKEDTDEISSYKMQYCSLTSLLTCVVKDTWPKIDDVTYVNDLRNNVTLLNDSTEVLYENDKALNENLNSISIIANDEKPGLVKLGFKQTELATTYWPLCVDNTGKAFVHVPGTESSKAIERIVNTVNQLKELSDGYVSFENDEKIYKIDLLCSNISVIANDEKPGLIKIGYERTETKPTYWPVCVDVAGKAFVEVEGTGGSHIDDIINLKKLSSFYAIPQKIKTEEETEIEVLSSIPYLISNEVSTICCSLSNNMHEICCSLSNNIREICCSLSNDIREICCSLSNTTYKICCDLSNSMIDICCSLSNTVTSELIQTSSDITFAMQKLSALLSHVNDNQISNTIVLNKVALYKIEKQESGEPTAELTGGIIYNLINAASKLMQQKVIIYAPEIGITIPASSEILLNCGSIGLTDNLFPISTTEINIVGAATVYPIANWFADHKKLNIMLKNISTTSSANVTSLSATIVYLTYSDIIK